jgi:hypothetical protein
MFPQWEHVKSAGQVSLVLRVTHPEGRVVVGRERSKSERFCAIYASLGRGIAVRRDTSWHPQGTERKRKALGVFTKCPTSLVAGAGFEPTTFGLWVHKRRFSQANKTHWNRSENSTKTRLCTRHHVHGSSLLVTMFHIVRALSCHGAPSSAGERARLDRRAYGSAGVAAYESEALPQPTTESGAPRTASQD